MLIRLHVEISLYEMLGANNIHVQNKRAGYTGWWVVEAVQPTRSQPAAAF